MDKEQFDGWVLTLRGEFGNYDDEDWSRVEVEGKVTTVFELTDIFQRMANSLGFDYVNVNVVNKGDDNV